MTPRPDTERFEKLADFFTETMENPKASKRVRLSAAMLLDDLLRRKERREDAESRRAEREAARVARERAEASERDPQPTPPEELAARETEQQRELAAERAIANLGKILQKSL